MNPMLATPLPVRFAPTPCLAPGVVEVFAGIGSVARGFAEGAQVETLLLNDIDPIARKAYLAHAGKSVPYFDRDIRHLRADTLSRHLGERTVSGLLGCPPCQGFSDAGQRLESDPRNRLVGSYFRLLRQLRPRFFVMENVERLLEYKVFKDLIESVSGEYRVWSGVLNAALYGVPQTRRRAIVIGYRNDLGVMPTMPLPTHLGVRRVFDYGSQRYVCPATKAGMVALGLLDDRIVDWNEELPAYLLEHGRSLKNLVRVGEAIGDLPPAGESKDALPYAEGRASEYAKGLHALGAFDHAPWNHKPETIERLRVVPEGGVLLGDGVRGRSRKYFSQAYSRLHRDGLARTITTNFHNAGSGRFLHFDQVRTLTVREAARIQGIPDSFRFDFERSFAERLIGNAFPQPMAKAIAAHVRAQIGDDAMTTPPK
jgi:DNA (cytosine-5)-methyltransferase 1